MRLRSSLLSGTLAIRFCMSANSSARASALRCCSRFLSASLAASYASRRPHSRSADASSLEAKSARWAFSLSFWVFAAVFSLTVYKSYLEYKSMSRIVRDKKSLVPYFASGYTALELTNLFSVYIGASVRIFFFLLEPRRSWDEESHGARRAHAHACIHMPRQVRFSLRFD